MAWNLSGTLYESCSCKMVCRCAFGPAEPDQGWCSALQVFDIQQGASDGADLSGCRVAVALQLPGDFFGGIEVARLYFDAAVKPEQRTQLEAIFTGTKGGVWEGVAPIVGRWLPPQVVKIELTAGDDVSVTVGAAAHLALTPLKTPSGTQATLTNPPVPEAFGLTTIDLFLAGGSGGTDADLRQWESLGHGGRAPFSWAA